MASSRKYWTDDELRKDAEYWETEGSRLFMRGLVTTRFADYYQKKRDEAAENAKASRDELQRRGIQA